MAREYRYKAFISYSHQDEKQARWLQRSLERFRTPKHLVGMSTSSGEVPDRIFPIFRDRVDLASSSDLSSNIEQALNESENLIVICSPAAATSPWVDKEIELFKQLGRSDNIYCLIVEGDPSSEDTALDCFPPALRLNYNNTGSRVEGIAEPIAADLRKFGDGKFLARLKIISGLLDIKLDALRRREHRRRQRRLLSLTATSVLISVVTITLAVNAILARKEVEQRQEQAEELLGFMVGDLRASLTPLGKLDLLQDVGDRAMKYFSTVNAADLTDKELLRQSQVLTQLGEIKLEQLQFDNALQSFTEAYERSTQLVELSPMDGDRLFNRGQAEYWVGYVHLQAGSVAETETWFTRYKNTSLELVKLDADRDDWLLEVGYAYHNLAVLAEGRGDLAEAASGYQHLLDTLKTIQKRSYSANRERDISDVISFLGNIAVATGKLRVAKNYFRQSSEVASAAFTGNPEDAVLKEEFAFSLLRLARIGNLLGDFAGSLENSERSLQLFDELLTLDLSNTDFQLDIINTNLVRAQTLLAQHRLDKSLSTASSSIASGLQLSQQGVQSFRLLSYLANTYLLRAWVYQKTDESQKALMQLELAFEYFTELQVADRMNKDRTESWIAALVTQGELLAVLDEEAKAKEAWETADNTVNSPTINQSSPSIQDSIVRINFHLGKTAQSDAAREFLAALGYVPLRNWPISTALPEY